MLDREIMPRAVCWQVGSSRARPKSLHVHSPGIPLPRDLAAEAGPLGAGRVASDLNAQGGQQRRQLAAAHIQRRIETWRGASPTKGSPRHGGYGSGCRPNACGMPLDECGEGAKAPASSPISLCRAKRIKSCRIHVEILTPRSEERRVGKECPV